MVTGKLDFGAMAEFPASLNGVAHLKAGKTSLFLTPLSGGIKGSGNGIVVPTESTAQSLADLKGKTISVPFASTAHGMLLRAIQAQGWNPETDVQIIAQAPEVEGSALQSNKSTPTPTSSPSPNCFPTAVSPAKFLTARRPMRPPSTARWWKANMPPNIPKSSSLMCAR